MCCNDETNEVKQVQTSLPEGQWRNMIHDWPWYANYQKDIFSPLFQDTKKEWGLVALAHPNATLDGVGVALKVKGRHSNDDITC